MHISNVDIFLSKNKTFFYGMVFSLKLMLIFFSLFCRWTRRVIGKRHANLPHNLPALRTLQGIIWCFQTRHLNLTLSAFSSQDLPGFVNRYSQNLKNLFRQTYLKRKKKCLKWKTSPAIWCGLDGRKTLTTK